jgi:hypothetical protein
LQEVVVKFSSEVRSVNLDGKLTAAFPTLGPKQLHQLREYFQEQLLPTIIEGQQIMDEDQSGSMSGERKRELVPKLRQMSAELHANAEKISSMGDGFYELAALEDRVKVLPARTGDDNVFARSIDLMLATKSWLNAANEQEADERGEAVRQVADEILIAVGQALRNGPLS